jgi:hypothetical protein
MAGSQRILGLEVAAPDHAASAIGRGAGAGMMRQMSGGRRRRAAIGTRSLHIRHKPV